MATAAFWGWLMFSIGVAGEFVFESWVSTKNEQLENLSNSLLADAQLEVSDAIKQSGRADASAARAEDSATIAQNESDNAVFASANAMSLARSARKELGLFRHDLVGAQDELDRIRTPRSLIDKPKLISTLKAFKGTAYTLFTFPDGESFDFTVEIGNALEEAGWVRQQPSENSRMLGMEYINLFQPPELVPVYLTSGIKVSVWSPIPLETLRITPESDRPESLRSAGALMDALPASITPPNTDNVVGEAIQVDNDVDFNKKRGYAPVIICVGKKPNTHPGKLDNGNK